MRKRIKIAIILLLPAFVMAQVEPIDTTFYSKGIIKTIRYDKDSRYTGHSVNRIFKKSKNALDYNHPLVDTLFDNSYKNKKNWTYYQGSTRMFLHENSNVYISKTTKNGYNKDSIYHKMNGVYCFLFKEIDDLDITLGYNNDTLINWFSLSIYDSIKGGFGFKELFFDARYDSKQGAKFSTNYQNFQCGNHGRIELFFRKNNLLHTTTFYPQDSTILATHYEFYEDFHCKQYGKVKGNIKIGEWYEYHPNSNISAIGKYEKNNNIFFSTKYEPDIYERLYSIKDGLWKYFDVDGNLIRKEWYEKGKLINKE